MMQTKYMINGTTVSVINLNTETTLDYLPPKIYTVQFNPVQGFYLSIVKDQLAVPDKIYGIAHARVDKCIKTYSSRTASTGILLTGDKGTGKSLLMSLLANAAITELNLPVIMITEPFEGEAFTTFISDIGECCVVFDEFGGTS